MISKPNEIDAEHTEELELLVSRYPWFAAGHILLAKAYKNAGRHSYKSLLKKASLYAGDRTLLFQLMENDPTFIPAAKEDREGWVTDARADQKPKQEVEEVQDESLVEDHVEEQELKENRSEIVQRPVEREATTSGHAIEDFLRSFGEKPEDILTREEERSEPVEENDQEVVPENEPSGEEIYVNDQQDGLEFEEEHILEDVHHIELAEEGEIEDRLPDDIEFEEEIPFRMGGMQLDAEADQPEAEDDEQEKPVYDPIQELRTLIPDPQEEQIDDKVNIPFTPMYNPEVELARYIETVDEDDEETIDEGSGHSFISWLDEFSAAKRKAYERREEPKKEEALPIPGSETTEERKPDPTLLLETFLKKKPRISKMKAEFYNPESMARRSESDESDIVSETLARLLLKQGHPGKAIEIYEKLKLQKPTNLAYFAARIEEIKAKHNLG